MPTNEEQEVVGGKLWTIVAINRRGHTSKILASMFCEIRCYGDEANMHTHNRYLFNDIETCALQA